MRSLKELAEQSYHINAMKGYTGNTEADVNIPLKIALIHSEASEALEAVRNERIYDYTKKKDIDLLSKTSDKYFAMGYRQEVKGSLGEELADIIIRVSSLAEELSIDIQQHVELKIRYNSLDDKVKKF